jgi:hypothetical protein
MSTRSIGPAIALLCVLTVVPVGAQSVEGTVFLSSAAGNAPTARSALQELVPTMTVLDATLRGPAGTSVNAISSAGSLRSTVVSAPQAEEGTFPWLQVGIGAGVAALFFSAVLTANSGDAAELPRGGISVVLPGT